MENRNKKWLLFAGVALFALAFTFMRGVQSRPAALDETVTYSELSQLDDAAVNTIDSDESTARDGHRHGRHGHRHGHGMLHMLFKILHIMFIVLGVLFIIKMIRRGRREERRRGRRRRGGRGPGRRGGRGPRGGRRHASWTNDEDEIENEIEVDIEIEVSEDDETDE